MLVSVECSFCNMLTPPHGSCMNCVCRHLASKAYQALTLEFRIRALAKKRWVRVLISAKSLQIARCSPAECWAGNYSPNIAPDVSHSGNIHIRHFIPPSPAECWAGNYSPNIAPDVSHSGNIHIRHFIPPSPAECWAGNYSPNIAPNVCHGARTHMEKSVRSYLGE